MLKRVNNIPINLDLLRIEQQDLVRLHQVSELQIFNNTGNFHPEGLFSTKIFANLGSEIRNRTFAYTDLHADLIHPFIYMTICSLKSFYKDIAEGRVTAIWDKKARVFVKSIDVEAQTGYDFFYQHAHELAFERNESDKHNYLIDLYQKAVKDDTLKMRWLLIMPAGLRDYVIDSSGKPQEDEINKLYRKVIGQANIIDAKIFKSTPDVYDASRTGIQKVLVELFLYIASMLEGKNKFILAKWLTRKVFNSTRNVVSVYTPRSDHLKSPDRLGYNDTMVGLVQFARAMVPATFHAIKTSYIRDIFIENNNLAYLTNVKTLKREQVLSAAIQKEYDLWTSPAGLEKVVASMKNRDILDDPILLNKGKHYMGLIYRDDYYFKFFQDIDEVPEGFDKEKVTPVTLAEFVYISIHTLASHAESLNTRFPIACYGGINAAHLKLKTTLDSDVLEELDHEWKATGKIAASFPSKHDPHFDTVSPHMSRWTAYGADTDGDMMSTTAVTTDEAKEEVANLFDSRAYYIRNNNTLHFSNSNITLNSVLSFLTR